MAEKGLSPRDFAVKYFDSRRESRGNRNPIRKKEWQARKQINKAEPKKKRATLKEEIKAGKHDRLLTKCGISGLRGKFGEDIIPAQVRMSKPGGFDTLRVLIRKALKKGEKYNGRTILSISTEGMQATVKMVQMGDDVQPYVHVYRLNLVTN